jgi:hypothetical protein
MPRSNLPRDVKPGLSNDPADKLAACLNYRTRNGGSEYERHPFYFGACREWHDALSEDWQDFVTYVIDAWSKWGEEYAKRWAARLPAAPRCPL